MAGVNSSSSSRTERDLRRDEVGLIWSIDRSEVVDGIYYLENGNLVLKPEHHDVSGWAGKEIERYTSILLDCYDRGGWFYGAFDGPELAGVVVLENRFIGRDRDQLQLKYLYVTRTLRNTGLGKALFRKAMQKAREQGAQRLYISATPSENTVRFYLRLGCRVTKEPDPELLALEPEDIHLECAL
jgi:predicted N-acetyltransferase YhbS